LTPVAAIYKVLSRAQWAEAQRDGVFRGAAIDLSDGYIHFSNAEQLQETVRRHFAARDDLALLAVDVEGLGDALRWEPSRGGALFPHLYAELPSDRVLWSKPFSSADAETIDALLAPP
jgi:uncharacterized protein (DUF952 family)